MIPSLRTQRRFSADSSALISLGVPKRTSLFAFASFRNTPHTHKTKAITGKGGRLPPACSRLGSHRLPAPSSAGLSRPQRPPQMLSCAPRKARKPSLPEGLRPWRAQEAPQSSALRLCRPACGRPPLRSGWGTPPLALAAPAGVGQGQGVFVSKHSTAIQKRRNHP
jgi:hypothetical protein